MLPEDHPPIDYENWSPPGDGEVRSPCPALNALANHHLINHDGKKITKVMAVSALEQALHIDPVIANLFTIGGLGANPDHEEHSFDLDHLAKHNYIEHDVSLSREDAAFGNQCPFNNDIFQSVISVYEAAAKPGTDVNGNQVMMTNWAVGCHARYSRLQACKKKHDAAGKQLTYGLGQAVASYGETSLILNLLGKDGVAPLQWVKILFEEERFPYKEGWRPPAKIDQGMLNHGYIEMMKAHQYKGEEAKMIALGTPQALTASILSLTSMMKVPSLGTAHPLVAPETITPVDDAKPVEPKPGTDPKDGKAGKKSKLDKCVIQ